MFNRGLPEPQYRPDPAARADLDRLANATGATVFDESELDAVTDRMRSALKRGPTVTEGVRKTAPGARAVPRSLRDSSSRCSCSGSESASSSSGTARRPRGTRSRPCTRWRGSRARRPLLGSPHRAPRGRRRLPLRSSSTARLEPVAADRGQRGPVGLVSVLGVPAHCRGRRRSPALLAERAGQRPPRRRSHPPGAGSRPCVGDAWDIHSAS